MNLRNGNGASDKTKEKKKKKSCMEWDLNHQPSEPKLHTLPTELSMTDRNMWIEELFQEQKCLKRNKRETEPKVKEERKQT